MILVLNYIEIQIGTFFVKGSPSLINLDQGLFRVIYTVALVTAYYFFARFFSSISEIKIEKLIYLGIIFSIIAQAVKFFNFPEQTIISLLFYLLNIIVVIIWGIKILRLNDSIDQNIRSVKYFVISLFSVFIINIIATAILLFAHLLEYTNFMFLLYIVPYTILTLIFSRLKRNNQPLILH